MADTDNGQQALTRTVSATQLGFETGSDVTAQATLTKEEKSLLAKTRVPFYIVQSKRIESEYPPQSDYQTGYWWAFDVQIGQATRVMPMSENIHNQSLYDGIARYTVQGIRVGPFRLQEIDGKNGTWYRLVRHEELDPDAGMSFDAMVKDELLKNQLALPAVES